MVVESILQELRIVTNNQDPRRRPSTTNQGRGFLKIASGERGLQNSDVAGFLRRNGAELAIICCGRYAAVMLRQKYVVGDVNRVGRTN